jgi:hypothetical protein
MGLYKASADDSIHRRLEEEDVMSLEQMLLKRALWEINTKQNRLRNQWLICDITKTAIIQHLSRIDEDNNLVRYKRREDK